MDVTFYVRRKEQEELIRAKGIRRMQQGGIEKVFSPASDNRYSGITRCALDYCG